MSKWAKYNKKYNPDWEKEPLFKGWLTESRERIGAFCKICRSQLRAHKSDLKKHASTEIHLKNLKRCKMISDNSQPSLERMGIATSSITDEMKIIELKITVYIALHSAVRAVDHLTDILNEVTSRKMRLHRTKCSMLIKKVISPSLLTSLKEDIGSSHYSLIIDESTDISINKYMAVMIRYFSLKAKKIKTEYLGIFEVTRATSDELYISLKEFLESIGLRYACLIGLGTDGANNMVGEFNSVYSKIKKDLPSVQLVKCVCHSIHLCSTHATEELPSNLDFLVRESYNWFSHSSLRKSNYVAVYKLMNDGSDPLKLNQPSTTRWLSRYFCIEKILSQWEELKLHFHISSIQEKCYMARTLHEMYKDDQNYLYLIFLRPVLKDLHTTNLLFQSENVDVSYVYDNLKSLLISLLTRFLKPAFLNHLKENNWPLLTVLEDLNNNLAYMKIDDVDFGFYFQKHVDELKENLTPETILNIKTRCCNFLKRVCLELCKRIPNNLTLLEKLKHFSPNSCLNQTRPKFPELPFNLVCGDETSNIELEQQWRNLIAVNWCDYFPNKIIELDTVKFWTFIYEFTNAIGEKPFQRLAESVLNLLSMPVSNAVVERTFSVMNAIKSKARNRLNFQMLDALLRIRTHCYSCKSCCKDFEPSGEMLKLFTSKMYLDLINENSDLEMHGNCDLQEIQEILDI